MNTQDKDYAEFDAFIRQYESMHGSLDDASAWAGWKAARLIAESEKSGWRTIDSAPKDYTHILVANAEDFCIAYFDKNKSKWCSSWNGDSYFHELFRPTHWMPLPAKPDA